MVPQALAEFNVDVYRSHVLSRETCPLPSVLSLKPGQAVNTRHACVERRPDGLHAGKVWNEAACFHCALSAEGRVQPQERAS